MPNWVEVLKTDELEESKGTTVFVNERDIALYKFEGDFYELGKYGKYSGAVSRKGVILRREFDHMNNGDISCVGQRDEDGFYQGLWGYVNSSSFSDNFKMVFDIEAPAIL